MLADSTEHSVCSLCPSEELEHLDVLSNSTGNTCAHKTLFSIHLYSSLEIRLLQITAH